MYGIGSSGLSRLLVLSLSLLSLHNFGGAICNTQEITGLCLASRSSARLPCCKFRLCPTYIITPSATNFLVAVVSKFGVLGAQQTHYHLCQSFRKSSVTTMYSEPALDAQEHVEVTIHAFYRYSETCL